MQHIQIGDLRLTLSNGEAKFSSQSLKDFPQVEARLQEVQTFIEDWLQMVQPSKSPEPSPEEKRIAEALNQMARGLYKTKAWKDREMLKNFILPSVASYLAREWGGITEERAQELVGEAVDSLK